MLRSDLIKRIAERNPHLYERDAEKIVSAIIDKIADALVAGDRVELRGFGSFSVRRRKPRDGRNPKTGEPVSVPEKFVPFFKTGREFARNLNVDDPVSRRIRLRKISSKRRSLTSVSVEAADGTD
jgi:integration host factor subunit beta